MEKIKVLIADDHIMVAKLIKHLLNASGKINVIDVVNDGNKVVNLVQNENVDVALLDIDMPMLDGIQTLIKAREINPDLKAIILSHHSEPWVIQKALESGASGYLTKYAEDYEVIEAVETVHNGGKYFCKKALNSIARNLVKDVHKNSYKELLEKLTSREREVLKLIADEFTNNEISDKLFISPRTVEIHRKNIMDKLGAKNIVALIKIVMESDLMNDEPPS